MNEKELVDILMKDNMINAIKKLGYDRSMEVIENLHQPVLRARLRQSLLELWKKIERI